MPVLHLYITGVPIHRYRCYQDGGIYIWNYLSAAATQVWNGVSRVDSISIFTKMKYYRYTDKLGIGYSVFLTVNSGSVLTTGILLLCYVTSTPTYNRVRPSLFVSLNS